MRCRGSEGQGALLRRAALAVDRSLAGENYWSAAAVDILFVCRPGGKA